MLLRCSKCRGSFEVEVGPRKAVVYCSHCGTALQIGGSAGGSGKVGGVGAGSGGASGFGGAESLAALAGGGAAEVDEGEEQLEQVVKGKSEKVAGAAGVGKKDAGGAGGLERASGREDLGRALGGAGREEEAGEEPVGDLGALVAGAAIGAARPPVRGRKVVVKKGGRAVAGRVAKKGSGTGVLVAILVAGGCVVVGLTVGAIVYVNSQTKAAAKPAVQKDPGDLFTNVKPTGGEEGK